MDLPAASPNLRSGVERRPGQLGDTFPPPAWRPNAENGAAIERRTTVGRRAGGGQRQLASGVSAQTVAHGMLVL